METIKIKPDRFRECKHGDAELVMLIDQNDVEIGERWVCPDCGYWSKNKCEVYSRVVGYMRPVSSWNRGKRQEFKERVMYKGILDDKKSQGGV